MSSPPDQLGSFQVLATLGAGNFGTVYLAQGEVKRRQGGPGKRTRVAIKQLHNPGDRTALDQLRAEFDLLEQVMHRSLCKVYDFLDDEAAVVMEVVHGVTLREVLDVLARHHERIPTEAAVEIGCEIADCLSQCWGTVGKSGSPLHLVHRDLKPENIMLTPKGEVKILDFGLARVEAKLGRGYDRSVKGTPLYMAPEQALGRGTDHRTDLFALGLILFELLMGRPAYEVSDEGPDPVAEVMKRIEHADLGNEVRQIESMLPGPGPVIARCLQASPRARYDTGHELMLDLRRQLTRDRGAYLADFCDYFFHKLHPLPPVGKLGPPSRGRSGTPTDQERSDKRRDAMANDKRSGPPRPGGRPPRPGGRPTGPRGAGGPARRGAPPRPGPPARPPSSAGPGGPRPPTPPRPPSPPSPPAPPSASPPAPGGGAGGLAGVKTGKETGMLQMVPLQKTDGDDVGGAPKSATQFFAIPKSKKSPKKPTPSAPAAGSAIGGPRAPGRSMPGGPGSLPPSSLGGAPGAVGGSLGSISGPTPAIGGPIASGPTASMGSGGGAHSPFQVGASPDTGASPDQRARSYRVYAIILTLFFFTFMAMVGTVAAVLIGKNLTGDQVVAEKAPSTSAKVEKKESKKTGEDTAVDIEEEEPPPPPPPRRRTTPRTTAAPAAPAAPAGPGVGVVKITLSGATALNVEIKCPSGFRKRGAFQSGTATVSGVPGGESCTAMLKGGAPLQANGIKANQSYTCSPAGNVLSCK